MLHITPNSPQSQNHEISFAQGASEVIEYKGNSIAIWTSNTPLHKGQTIAAIGDCIFKNAEQSVQLLNYTKNHLQNEFNTIVAPMNGNTWLAHRIVTYTDDSPPFMLEPNTPSHWNDIFKEAGFETISRYTSSRIKLQSSQGRFDKLEKKITNNKVIIRTLNPLNFEQDLSLIYELSCESFKNNFLYTELPKHLFLHKYKESQPHLDSDLILLAERNNELMAFVFCYPCSTNPNTLIVKTLASKQDRSIAGIGNLLVEKVQQTALQKGYKTAIHALQFDDNTSLKITARYNPTVFRKYALMAITTQL